MKAYEMRDLGLEALESRVAEANEELMTMRLQLKGRTLDNPLDYRKKRREVARMKTVLNELRRDAAKE